MKRVKYNEKKEELTITISIDEEVEIQQAIYHYNEYLKGILRGVEKGLLKSVEDDVEILDRLQKEI